MNEFVHVGTGYLAARALGYREHRFETLFVALAAYSPDFDAQLRHLSPFFAHGIWTHTIVGVAIMGLVLAAIGYAVTARLKPEPPVGFMRLWGLAMLGGLSHLCLDAFTFYYSDGDATHHMYFWPLWNFPWHINTIFPGTTFTVRVWVEVIYSVLVGCVILPYQWVYRKENPFRMLNPRGWFRAG